MCLHEVLQDYPMVNYHIVNFSVRHFKWFICIIPLQFYNKIIIIIIIIITIYFFYYLFIYLFIFFFLGGGGGTRVNGVLGLWGQYY